MTGREEPRKDGYPLATRMREGTRPGSGRSNIRMSDIVRRGLNPDDASVEFVPPNDGAPRQSLAEFFGDQYDP